MSLMLLTLITCLAMQGYECKPTDRAEPDCKILNEKRKQKGGTDIGVKCNGGMKIFVDIDEEEGKHSFVKISGEKNKGSKRHFMTVDYDQETKEMFITIDNKRFDVKDKTSQEEEMEQFKQLIVDPDFTYIPSAVRLIHDELQLKGWESPAAMFLYRIGIAAEEYRSRDERLFSWGEPEVDPLTRKYHGPKPNRKCKFNGWSVDDMDILIKDTCTGVCGQTCADCWTWVCGDCCAHTGCKRHDEFCGAGYFTSDCLTARGVLWDTITDSPLDC